MRTGRKLQNRERVEKCKETSEFENICKVICGFSTSDKSKSIVHICNKVFDKIEDIKSIEIEVKGTEDLSIKPFESWDKINQGSYSGGKGITM